ncbi:hypothetical protein RHGRI_013110 [Rhododendron griersonianum]|nr:hypothetical protein RHGRI_013110 [Rhododendron griersonianum]KAG5547320.1 hypothetical protein RHGRI_013110 [Rhododendron griersonianum]
MILDLGTVDPAKYPLPHTRPTLEFLRDYVHLLSRTNTISAIARIRNALAYATHTFFQKHGFLYVHTPIITTSDCEGAGEMFQVTTLISDAEKLEKELIKNPPPSEADVEVAKLLVTEKGEAIAQLKSAKANKETISAAISAIACIRNALAYATHTFFQKHGFLYVHTPVITTSDCEGAGEMFQVTTLISDAEKLEKELIKKPPPSEADVEVAKLLVTEKGEAVAQLKSTKVNKETIIAALQVETFAFGPTFRAEHSLTSRHLAEFWMVEPEVAFADIQDDMNCAVAYVRSLCQWLLDNCLDDMEFMV